MRDSRIDSKGYFDFIFGEEGKIFGTRWNASLPSFSNGSDDYGFGRTGEYGEDVGIDDFNRDIMVKPKTVHTVNQPIGRIASDGVELRTTKHDHLRKRMAI